MSSGKWLPFCLSHDVQFSCAMTQPLLAHHWRVHQCLLTSRFITPLIPWELSAPGGKMRNSFFRTITFLIIHRFLSLKVLLWYICFPRRTAYNTFQFEKLFWIWWKILDTIILWQEQNMLSANTCSLWSGIKSRPGVVGSSHVCLCHRCIIDVMLNLLSDIDIENYSNTCNCKYHLVAICKGNGFYHTAFYQARFYQVRVLVKGLSKHF